MFSLPPQLPQLPAAIVLATSFVAGAEVRAAEPEACTVRLASEDDGKGWKSAVVEAEARVRALPAEANDCRSIEVHVAIDGAVVVFTTRDGRQAVRHVATPAELAATIDALLVTTPPPAIVEPPPASTTGTAPSTPDRAPAKPTAAGDSRHGVPRVDARRVETRAFGIVEAGGRLAAPGRFVSPLLSLGAHVVLDRWELGVDLTWEPIYSTSLPAPPGFDMLATVVGMGIGRREPLGRGFEVSAMGRAGIALVHEEREGELESGEPQGSRAQMRLGLSGSIIYAKEAPFRVRATLAGDYVPTKLGGGQSVDPLLPKLPSWGATLSIGLEADLP
jgi:hypothetical protein